MTALVGVEEIVAAGARCSLTKSVLAEWAASGTPRQMCLIASKLRI